MLCNLWGFTYKTFALCTCFLDQVKMLTLPSQFNSILVNDYPPSVWDLYRQVTITTQIPVNLKGTFTARDLRLFFSFFFFLTLVSLFLHAQFNTTTIYLPVGFYSRPYILGTNNDFKFLYRYLNLWLSKHKIIFFLGQMMHRFRDTNAWISLPLQDLWPLLVS